MSSTTIERPLSYDRPGNAAIAETIESRWNSETFDAVEWRYRNLAGELPPQARAIAVVPVSLNEESVESIVHLLAQYAKQDVDPEIFGVLLSFNYCGDFDHSKWQDINEAISGAGMCPRYVASMTVGYAKPESIGGIRTDAWNVAMMHLYARGITHQVTGISNDVDIRFLPKDYVRRMVEAVEQEPSLCYGGLTMFEGAGPTHLVANQLLRYVNFLGMMHARRGTKALFEHNMALSFNAYAKAGSWGDRVVGEARSLLFNLGCAHQHLSELMDEADIRRFFRHAPGVSLRVSGRRMLSIYTRKLTDANAPTFRDMYDFRTDGHDVVRQLTPQEELRMVEQDFSAESIRRVIRAIDEATFPLFNLHDLDDVRRAVTLLSTARRIIGLSEYCP